MYSAKTTVVSTLNTITPSINVYYEKLITDKITLPCITYIESNNSAAEEGDTLRYSKVNYQIKLWAEKLSEIETYEDKIDTVMFAANFKRTSTQELIVDTHIIKVMNYEAVCFETEV